MASASSRRLFFALWPTESVRQQIAVAGAAAARAAGGRPIAPANYHITLAFLGSVPLAHVDAVIMAGQRVTCAPFSLQLDRTGSALSSQVTWLQPAACPRELSALVAALWVELGPLGFAADARAYQPHVSLARNVAGELGGRLERPIEWSVDGFVLACSENRAGGSTYTLLERFPAVS